MNIGTKHGDLRGLRTRLETEMYRLQLEARCFRRRRQKLGQVEGLRVALELIFELELHWLREEIEFTKLRESIDSCSCWEGGVGNCRVHGRERGRG